MTWDEYFINLLKPIALKSKDESTQIAAIIVGPDNEIRSTGYNSFPRGINDSLSERQERPEKYFWFEHAERNAIYNAARHGTQLENCRIYISGIPCMDCSRAIVQCGIKEVIIPKLEDNEHIKRWEEDYKRTRQLFKEAGVTLYEV